MEVKLTDNIGLGKITDYSFYNSLLKNDIKTVSDLLDEDKVNEVMDSTSNIFFHHSKALLKF